ncbi:MAG: glutathione transferase GstA [Ferrovum sp.]|jgi:glutathione S-transferase|nr:glutathione transferase GstA [Ferrovum sp.]NDU87697.1 glutathione transferase GstA [Ferrovum sp.]
MKLYYSPGACSLSPHIVLHECGLPFDIEKVDLATKLTSVGQDFRQINPKGYVPALILDNGHMLTEGPAIIQYVADLVPHKNLAPSAGSLERYQLQEWLNYLSTEIHKGFTPLFFPTVPQETKESARKLLTKRIGFVATALAGRDYLMGPSFSVADAYLFTVLSWAPHVGFDLSPWPVLQTYQKRVGNRPAVQATLKAEGLMV